MTGQLHRNSDTLLNGPQVGTVTMKDSIRDSGAAVRITFFYQNRFGDRISSRE